MKRLVSQPRGIPLETCARIFLRLQDFNTHVSSRARRGDPDLPILDTSTQNFERIEALNHKIYLKKGPAFEILFIISIFQNLKQEMNFILFYFYCRQL